MKQILICVVLLGLVVGIAVAAQVKCPYCGGNSYMTGKSQLDESGHLLYEYQCMIYRAHKFWARAN